MAYKVTAAKWLATETARVEGIILLPRYNGKEWSPADFIAAMAEVGLTYTTQEMTLIGGELVTQGVIEEV